MPRIPLRPQAPSAGARWPATGWPARVKSNRRPPSEVCAERSGRQPSSTPSHASSSSALASLPGAVADRHARGLHQRRAADRRIEQAGEHARAARPAAASRDRRPAAAARRCASRSTSNSCWGRRQAVVSNTRRLVTGMSSRASSDSGAPGSSQNVAVGTPATCSARTSAPKWPSALVGPGDRDLLRVDHARAARLRHDVALDRGLEPLAPRSSSRQRVSVRVGSAGAISSTSCLVAASAVRPRAAMITFHSAARETATRRRGRGAGLLPAENSAHARSRRPRPRSIRRG